MSLDRVDWSRNSIGILVFVSALGLSIRYLFSDVVRQLYSLMSVEEYSYILTALAVSVLLLAISLGKTIYARVVRLSNLFTATVFILTSMVFYVLAKIILFYSLTLSAISMVLFIWGLFIVFYSRESLKKLLLPLISLSMLIPLPREFIDSLSVYLTRSVAILSSFLSGAEIISNPSGRIYLVATGGAGKVSFEIITACSGIISISSFIALVPLLIYLTRNSSLSRRIKAVLLSTITGLVIVFFGNVLRVTVMILLAKSYGIDIAYSFFHSAPSYVYSALAVVASIIVLYKLSKPQKEDPPNRGIDPKIGGNSNNGLRTSYSTIIVFMLFFLVVMGIVLYTQGILAHSPSNLSLSQYSYDYVISNTLSVILKDDIKIVYEKPVPALERALGSSLVKSIGIRYNKTFLAGYVEFAETPSRFHGWWVCLTYQGYSVKRVWTEEAEPLVITFVEYSRNNRTYLLGYVIFEIPLYFSNQTVDTGYIRLSLFIPVKKSIADAAEEFKTILGDIVKEDLLHSSEKRKMMLETLSMADMFLVIATTGYYFIAFISHGVYSFITGLKKRFYERS